MRSSTTRYALAVLALFLLSGCRSAEKGWHMPTMSVSSLNPFSSSPDEMPETPKPSELASPSPSMPPGVGYAEADSGAPGAESYPSASTGRTAATSPGAGSPYTRPVGTAGSLAGRTDSVATANPATTPQSGLYSMPSGSAPSASSPALNTGGSQVGIGIRHREVELPRSADRGLVKEETGQNPDRNVQRQIGITFGRSAGDRVLGTGADERVRGVAAPRHQGLNGEKALSVRLAWDRHIAERNRDDCPGGIEPAANIRRRIATEDFDIVGNQGAYGAGSTASGSGFHLWIQAILGDVYRDVL